MIKTVRYPWTATVVGRIIKLSRNNVDKSGRNPKWFINIVVEPVEIEAPHGKTLVGDVEFLTTESDLLPRLGGRMPMVGDLLAGTGRATDAQTSTLLLTGAKVLEMVRPPDS